MKQSLKNTKIATPLIYHSDLKDSYKVVVYELTQDKKYSDMNFRLMDIIDLEQDLTLQYPGNFENYAYGILINSYHTRIFGLDFDQENLQSVNKIAEVFMKDQSVYGIDIIRSSYRNGMANYHMIIGLTDYFNVNNIYSINIPKVCKGHRGFVNTYGEILLRISRKFWKQELHISNPATPMYISSKRKEDNIWIEYTTSNIVKPIQFNQIPDKEHTIEKDKHKIKVNLRRHKHGQYSTKSKEQGPSTSAANSIEDLRSFSRVDRARCTINIDGSPRSGLMPF